MNALGRHLPLLTVTMLGIGLLYGAFQLLGAEESHSKTQLEETIAISSPEEKLEEEADDAEEMRSVVETTRSASLTSKIASETEEAGDEETSSEVETRIEGAVLDMAGRPLIGALVYACNEEAPRRQRTRTTSTDENGRFRFEGAAPGSYHLSLSDDGASEVGPLVLHEGDIVEHLLQSERHPELDWRILDEYGQPLASARIRMWARSGHRVISTDDQGRATMPHVPSGEYHVRVIKQGYRSVGQEVIVDSARGVLEMSLGNAPVAVQ